MFEKELRRFIATNEYHKAFMLCLNNMSNTELSDIAFNKALILIKEHSHKVMDKGYVLKLNQKLDDNWLLDVAIKNGYKNIRHSTISVGLFTSIPSITISGLLARQRLGIKHNKDGTSTIYYRYNWFCDEFKLIRATLTEVVELYKNIVLN